MRDFNKFTDVESFGHVWRNQQRLLFKGSVQYGLKIKLHGTNAGARLPPEGFGDITAQSKSRDITPACDNAGFARWMDCNLSAFEEKRGDVHTTIFGEWAGLGIQKNDAVTKLKDKFFFVFAVQLGDMVVTDPDLIENLVPDLDNLLVIPWFHIPKMPVDFGDSATTNTWLDELNVMVEAIGERDPFIYETFGIDGVGEGVVAVPVETVDRTIYSKLIFKAKSTRHRVKNTEKAAKLIVEVPQNVLDFVATFVTEARADQGITEACDGVPDKRKTKFFMQWMGQDIKKESAVELEEMGLEWKAVSKEVNSAVSRLYMKRCDGIA